MFIELTEIITDGLQSFQNSKSKTRKILVNTTKIQSIYPDSVGKTIIQLRRDNIKVEENYEQVVALILEDDFTVDVKA
jgi:hypothetical protein